MLIAPSVLFLSLLQVTAIDSDVYYAEAKSGSNHYEVRADGTVDSLSKLQLQGIDIDSHATITYASGKAVSLVFDETMMQAGKVVRQTKVTVKDGKAKILSLGSTKPVESNVELITPLFSNFHPQLLNDLGSLIQWDMKAKKEIRMFVLEGAVAISVGVLPDEGKTIVTSSGNTPIRIATATVGTATMKMVFTEDKKFLGFDVPAQKFRWIKRGFESAFEDPLVKFSELSQPTYTAATTQIDIPLRDGVTTKATMTRPTKEGKYPVVLSRTPYGRVSSNSDSDLYARRGYVYISQDVRGTGDSNGKFDPMNTERKDGYDTIDWISKQSWCDGNVGMIGASYGGYVQWAAAVEFHPALKCLIPQVSPPSSAMWNIPYENGVLTMLSDLWWLRIVDNPKGTNMLEALNEIKNIKGLTVLPLDQADDKLLGFNSKVWSTWLSRDTEPEWTGWSFDHLMPKVKIPALHISGWFDGDEIGTQRNWQLVRSGGNNKQWLIYGPWTHFFNTTSKVGNIDFGKEAILELDSLYLRWFDTWLKGRSVGIEKVPKVRYFVTGENKWRESIDWPPIESKESVLKFQFGSGNSGPKSKALLVSTLKKDTLTKSKYDPRSEKIETDAMGVGDQGEDMYLKDAQIDKSTIFLKSEPFGKDRLLTGPVTVEFDFKSSARDTDFYVTAFDNDPVRGHMPIFKTGKLKASYLGGLDKQRFLVPGKTYRAKLLLWDGAHVFKKGHRLSLMIMHSQFPSTARNLGTDEPILTGKKMVVQNNTIFSKVKSPGIIKFRVIE